MRQEAMRYGEQAQQVFDLMRQNPNVQNQMRAPLYEEKVVDLILARASVADKAVSKEELLKEDDLPEVVTAPAKKSAKPKPARITGGACRRPRSPMRLRRRRKKAAKPKAKPA